MLKRLVGAGLALCLSAALAQAFWQSRDSNYNLSIPSTTSNLSTPVFGSFDPPTSGTTTFWSPLVGASLTGTLSSASTGRRIPIPIAATIKSLFASFTNAQPNATLTAWENTAAGSVVCTTAGTTPDTCVYSGAGDVLAAGTLLQWEWQANGTAWAQTSNVPTQISFIAVASNGQQGFLLSAPSNTSDPGTTTVAYAGFGGAWFGGATAVTESNMSSIISIPGEIDGLYVIPNATENATPHVYTVYKNGVATAMTCTAAASASTGCCVNLTGSGTIGGGPACGTTSSVSVLANDTLSVQYSCAGAPTVPCAGVFPGASLIWKPTNANQVPLTAQINAALNTSRWTGLEDISLNANNVPFQTTPNVPVSITLSNFIACVNTNPTGSGSWIMNINSATAPGTAPTTNTGLANTISNGLSCPGANPYSWFGAQDTTHTFSALAGYSLVDALTLSGSPVGSAIAKFAMAVTVP